MISYLIRRLLYSVPIALGVSLMIFMLVHLAPGDPISAIAPADAPPDVVERLRVDYGYDKPLPIQFGLWLGRAVTGDLGNSVASGQPVAAEVMSAVGNTILLSLCAAVFGFTLGAVLGFVAGYKQGRAMDKIATAIAVAGISVPHYWLGMVLVIVFSVQLNALPAVGMGPGGSNDWAWDWLHMRHLILPAITLAVIPIGIVMRTTRSAVAEILNQEFVQALRAKGLSERHVLGHVIRNVAPTVLAVMGLQLGYLLGGSILIETVFSWPGTGFLLNTAIFRRDIPMLQGTILVLALFFVFLNVVVDLIQTAVDPRIKRA
ncbi:ABC transporter permease [Skermanella stibiiresistens SB22]|jgi:peptide/nickel transport system permease protein|uniref:ABC transporter permease n=1 Tax=Skermanella stibiiresistens SB22 TaxID=1385369 RepID=W9GYX8_9PROT|nr:ABC transporter permease [Skermanella stibiiresistens]EWY36673.1 ABC transporter permease [Skermanella stibiiresistens SB22]